MFGGNGCNPMKLCPFSFGLALGLTSALAALVMFCWMIYQGPTPMMMANHIPVPSMGEGFRFAGILFLKGFVAGFVVALFYDLVACCMAKCCKKSKGSCECCCCGSRKKGK